MKTPRPLDAVLRLRQLSEEQEERLLEKILLEVAKTEELVRKEQQHILAAYEARSKGSNLALGSDVQASYGQIASHTERVYLFEEQKRKLGDLADQQRSVLKKARQQRETVDSLLQQRRMEAELLERRREQRTMDDIHGAQRIRKQLAEKSLVASDSQSAREDSNDIAMERSV